MATKINVRSPFFSSSSITDRDFSELILYIYDGTKDTDKGDAVYVIEKVGIEEVISGTTYTTVMFEFAELVRDYLNVTFDGTYDNYNKWVTYYHIDYLTSSVSGTTTTTITNKLIDTAANFSGLSAGEYVINQTTGDIAEIVTVDSSVALTLSAHIMTVTGESYTAGIEVPNSGDLIAFDGYGYFKEGQNPALSQSYLQSNTKIYRLEDHNVRVPIDKGVATSATFRLNGETVKSQTFSTSNESDEQVIYFNVGGSDADTYAQRVKLDGGTLEQNSLLDEFFGVENVGLVDEIYISSLVGSEVNEDGDTVNNYKTDVLEIITEPCSKYEPYKVVFVNKFGALQDLFFSLKSTERINTKGERYKANIFGAQGGAYDINKHQYQQYQQEGKESLILNTGYLSEDYNEVIKQLMLSEQVWAVRTDSADVLPVIPTTSSVTYKTSVNDKLVQYTIEFEQAFDKINSIR